MILSDDQKYALASEFVLGTLRGKARIRFKKLLKNDARLQSAVRYWEEHLTSLCEVLPNHEPKEDLWRKIKSQINQR